MAAIGENDPYDARLGALFRFLRAIFADLDIVKLRQNYMAAIHDVLPADAYELQLASYASRKAIAASTAAQRAFLNSQGEGALADEICTARFIEVGLSGGDRTLGRLSFARRDRQPAFDDADVQMIRAVAYHTSLAVSRALSHHEMIEGLRRAELAMEKGGTAVVFGDGEGHIWLRNSRGREITPDGFDAGTSNGIHAALQDNASDLQRLGVSAATRLAQVSGPDGDYVIVHSIRSPAVGQDGSREQAMPAHEETVGLLSKRELEVLGLMVRGMRNREIANELVVSTDTAKFHVKRIFRKMGVSSRSALLAKTLSHSHH